MKQQNIAICPGSFDPVTRGHLNVIERSAQRFDRVIVLVMVNPSKTPCFTAEERADFLRRATAHISNVQVDVYTGLLAEYAWNVGASTVIKGLRAVTDFEYEFQQALTNKKLNPGLDTMFVITDPEYMYLSSSMVRQVASFGGDVSDFLPAEICEDVVKRLASENKPKLADIKDPRMRVKVVGYIHARSEGLTKSQCDDLSDEQIADYYDRSGCSTLSPTQKLAAFNSLKARREAIMADYGLDAIDAVLKREEQDREAFLLEG